MNVLTTWNADPTILMMIPVVLNPFTLRRWKFRTICGMYLSGERQET